MGARDGADEEHGVQVDVRVEPGEGQRGTMTARLLRARSAAALEVSAAHRAPTERARTRGGTRCRANARGDQHAAPARRRSRPRHSRQDEDQIGDRADPDDQQHVVPTQALAQHERVLGADRDDQRQAGGETVGRSQNHVTTVGARKLAQPRTAPNLRPSNTCSTDPAQVSWRTSGRQGVGRRRAVGAPGIATHKRPHHAPGLRRSWPPGRRSRASWPWRKP